MAMLPQQFSPGVQPNVMVSDANSASLQDRKLGEYSSEQKILLVGEGDFSFSSALASAFGTAANITATSLDSLDEIVGKYGHAVKAALSKLVYRGAVLLHNIDATELDLHPFLSNLRFDRIVWNFPHAGIFGREMDEMVILNHRHLLGAFFSNVSKLLTPEGEVHVSHQSREPYLRWRLEDLAQLSGLQLKETVPFRVSDYPGYCNRRGAGEFASRSFRLRNTETYKFVGRSLPLPARSFPLEAFHEIGRMPIPHINNPAPYHDSAPMWLPFAGSQELASPQRSFRPGTLGPHPNSPSSMSIPSIPFPIEHGPSVNFNCSFNPSSVPEVRWALQPLESNFLDYRFPLVGGGSIAGDLGEPDMSEENVQAGKQGIGNIRKRKALAETQNFLGQSTCHKLDQTSGMYPTILDSNRVGDSKRICKTGKASVKAHALENATICTAPASTRSKKKRKKKKKKASKTEVTGQRNGQACHRYPHNTLLRPS